MRLSTLVGDYSSTGLITDRKQYIGIGGETEFPLTFVDGSEEVYMNGGRLYKGPTRDYVTSNGLIILNEPVRADDEILLVGRAAANDIPMISEMKEVVVLTDGQTEVPFITVDTTSLDIYIGGPMVDRGRLIPQIDYTIRTDSTSIIDLKSSYPAGTSLWGIQGSRVTTRDIGDQIIFDGTRSKSLSDRFADIQDTQEFFIQSSGMQSTPAKIGTVLRRRSVDEEGYPIEDPEGRFPVLTYKGSYWDHLDAGEVGGFIISAFQRSGEDLIVRTIDSQGSGVDVQYVRRVVIGVNAIKESVKKGSVDLVQESTRAIIFDAPELASDYQISLCGNTSDNLWWSDKSETGFTLNKSTEGDASIDWVIHRGV